MELQRSSTRRLKCGTAPCPPAVGRVASSSRALRFSPFSPAPAPAPCPSLLSRADTITTTFRATSAVEAVPSADLRAGNKFRVLIAGAGIGGLVLAVSLLKKGVDVVVLERDLTAIRGEGKYRGPIQIQSNALAALEAIDPAVADEVMRNGCITGDRINGLCDGITGEWYIKFDTFHPAVDKGMPVTRVISRVKLQEILAEAVVRLGGPNTIVGQTHIVSYEDKGSASGKPVVAVTEDGRRFSGDMLVGADGIWSKIRKQMVGDTPAHYSEYTCYTGVCDYTPADIDVVGYRVFLGSGQYFVSSDVGDGKMQWYAFHKEPANGVDAPGQRKARLMELFGSWAEGVVDLIQATPEDDVLRRDIYDRAPMFKWWEGRVGLLGDSAHAMQPNLGQGGCMAIEDAFELAELLGTELGKSPSGAKPSVNIERVLGDYQGARMMRVSAVAGMAGMAAFMASTYKAYLGEDIPGPIGREIAKFKVPHPGRVAGQFVMKYTMPGTLGWVLGGNTSRVDTSNRAPYCRLTDKPHAFNEHEFPTLMDDNEQLLAAAAPYQDMVLSPQSGATVGGSVQLMAREGGQQVVVRKEGGASTNLARLGLGRGSESGPASASGAGAWVEDASGTTWLLRQECKWRQLAAGERVTLVSGDVLGFGAQSPADTFKVKLRHISQRPASLAQFAGHIYQEQQAQQAEPQQQVPMLAR